MALGWLSLLKIVPWSDVINNAPKVAEAAKKLWTTVARKPDQPRGAESGVQSPFPAEGATIEARVAALESAYSDLHAQMLASSALIQTLAEQNAELIRRVEANQLRQRRLGVAALLFAIVVGSVLLVLLLRDVL